MESRYYNLELLEEANYQRNKFRSYSCFIVGGKLNTQVNKDIITKSLQKLFDLREKLRLNVFIEGDDQQARVREIKSKWQNDWIEFLDLPVESITNVLDPQHEVVFEINIETPLWRPTVINQEWILILFDHTLYDGTTGALMLEDLIKLMNGSPLIPDPKLDMFEFHKLINPSISYTIQKLFQEFTPKFIQRFANWAFIGESEYETFESGWKIDTSKKKITFKTFKHLISIDSTDFLALKSLLSKERVRFTSFLLFLSIISLSSIRNQEAPQVSVPFNIRTLLPEEFKYSYGLFVSHVSFNAKPVYENGNINWDYVRYIDDKLQNENLRNWAKIVGMLKFINRETWIKQGILNPRNTTLEISNLGLRSNCKDHNLKFDEFIFSQPNSLTGAFISNNVISSSEKVNILITGAPESEPFFKEFAINLENNVKKIIDSL